MRYALYLVDFTEAEIIYVGKQTLLYAVETVYLYSN